MSSAASSHVVLKPTQCPICETFGNADEMYSATLDDSSFSAPVFSARRLPDGIHYRMVRCRGCGLVRSDPAAGQLELAGLYARSTFDYAAEVPNLRQTYSRYLAKAKSHTDGRSYLEIGCGNGFMLEAALALGYQEAYGVEPSRDAVASAAATVQNSIVADVLHPGLFEPGAFDTVCMFQTFDHVADPRALLSQIRPLLKPRGVLLCLHHNVRSVSAALLGERSPIVDVEHFYLYSPATMTLLLEKCGFEVIETGPATNTVSLQHLVRLIPAPRAFKSRFMAAGGMTGLGRVPLRLRLGNLFVIGRKR